MDLNSLLLDSRMVLKAMKDMIAPKEKGETTDQGGNAPVPAEPADPDRLDPRAEGASPTESDLASAKEEGESDSSEAGGAEAQGNDTQGGDGAIPSDGAGVEGQGNDSPGGSPEFDEFGHHDMDAREIKKAFPAVAHLFPEEGVEEFLKGGLNSMAELISTLMETVKSQNLIIQRISKEVDEMKTEREAPRRELKKALDGISSLEARLDHLHETVPPMSEPRAIVKANPGNGGQVPLTQQDLYRLAGKIPAHEIAVLSMQLNRAE